MILRKGQFFLYNPYFGNMKILPSFSTLLLEELLEQSRSEQLRSFLSSHFHFDLTSQQLLPLLQTDPTSIIKNGELIKKGSYILWLLRCYSKMDDAAKKRFLEEDLGKYKEALELFEKLKIKNKLPQEARDINRFQDYGALVTFLEPFEEKPIESERDKNKEEQNEIKQKETKFIHDGAKWLVVTPLTERSSCFWGRNTRWCTASKKNNQFSTYKNHPLYICINKVTHKKWQVDFKDKQCMNDKDQESFVVLKSKEIQSVFGLKKIVSSFPVFIRFIKNPSDAVQMATAKRDGYALLYIQNPSEAVQMAAVEQNGTAIRFIKNPSEAVEMAAVKQSWEALRFIKNPTKRVLAHSTNP